MVSDNNHPFFRPLWRRILIVAVCLAWSAVEWWNGQTVWGVMTLAIAGYAAWVFLLNYEAAPGPSDLPPRER